MVVFVDLDEHESDPRFSASAPTSYLKTSTRDVHAYNTPPESADEKEEERENPNIGKFSEVLTCYPYEYSLDLVQTTYQSSYKFVLCFPSLLAPRALRICMQPLMKADLGITVSSGSSPLTLT